MRYEIGIYEAKCPYFEAERKRSIKCEGIVREAYNVIEFETEEEKERHLDECCSAYPNDCPIAMAIGYKYMDDE